MNKTETENQSKKESAPSEAVRVDAETMQWLKYREAVAPNAHRAAFIAAQEAAQ